MSEISKKILLGDQELLIETGKIARQANGSVMITCDGTTILATVAARKEANPNQSFFPLSVNYQEKTYAAGKIPGGFFKREGRPSEKETLISRLIDRPLRPSFPKGFMNEVQVILTVMSLNPEVQTDVIAMIGASAALSISDLPFNGPIGGARVGYINGNYVLNPSLSSMDDSKLNLMVAGTKDAILMVESEANELSEEVMLGAVMYGHEQMQTVIDAIQELKDEVGKEQWQVEEITKDPSLVKLVNDLAFDKITSAYQIADKVERQQQLEEIRTHIDNETSDEDSEYDASDIKDEIKAIEKSIVRDRILNGDPRIDGRDTTTVRNIDVEVDVLERTHGSALFTRGETQAIVVATLGTERYSQIIDALEGEYKDKFMLHYNFPPYSVGETGFIGSPKRREIGHGKLARRALEAVLPDMSTFPYTIRLVSEITESNGSSSMATVCGSSLALMHAGVPIKAPVAGIAMGLVKDGDKYQVLTDILGDEDHLGDMDFKVAGTTEGITALQMDIKIDGITKSIMDDALVHAKTARLHILDKMNEVINKPSDEYSNYAPSIITITVAKDKIRDVIGKGGATIKSLTEITGAQIDINDDGIVTIASVDKSSGELAKEKIELLTKDVELNTIYEGRVAKIMDFGAFVTILPGKDGLVHISEISNERVESVDKVLSEGQIVKVKVIEIDRQKRIRLSIKAIENEKEEETTTEES
ncbi:MAG: polyribonucleotide nucleotidyltransferase [Gammaproteobacteria bacterium]|nr:polyribonucleotide nucleotidyltransferase [Gammaproteobacteria bacterium]